MKYHNDLWLCFMSIAGGLVLAWILVAPSHAQTQLIAPAKLRAMLATLPECEDSPIFDAGEFQAILRDPTTLWYTHEEMPPAYQIGGGADGNIGPLRFSDVMINVSNAAGEGDKADGFGGNANIDAPWKTRPGGTNHVKNLRDFKGVYRPKQANGKPYPIVTYQRIFTDQRRAGDRAIGTDWIFPVGTVFLEVLVQRAPDGRDYVFEIRVRKRVTGDWEMDVLRPFPTPDTLEAAIRNVSQRWYSDTKSQEVVRLLRDTRRTIPAFELKEIQPGERFGDGQDITTFYNKVQIDYLPPLSERHDALVAHLLTHTAFASALGEDWNIGNNKEAFHLVPFGYDGAFVGNDFQSCKECHKHCGIAARRLDRGRGWQGAVRGGNEQILSFHPIEPSSYVGTKQGRPGPVVFRKAFLDAGVIEPFDTAKHQPSMYHLLRELPRL
jgi:hypothetical protein